MVDIRGALRLAGVTNPLLFGPAALATEVAYNLYPAEKKTKDNLERQIGSVLSYLNEQPYKVYAGEDYGPQSVGSYLKLRQSDPDRFPRPTGLSTPETKPPKSRTPAPKPTPPQTTPDWNNPPGGGIPDPAAGETPQDTSAQGFGTEVRKPASEPGFEQLLKFVEDALSPENRRLLTDESIRQVAATSAITQALGAEKSRERYKREIELERIKSWTDMYKTAQQTNVLSQALLGQALIASQQPSANVADILGKGTQAAQSVLGGFQLKT